MPFRSTVPARLALVLFGSVVGLGLAELVVRVLWPYSPPDGAGGLPRLQTQLELARPSTRGLSIGVLHRTNRMGFRGRDYAARPPADVFRIVLGGDSFAMGHGVAEEDRYSDRLASLLDAARSGERHEVVNSGLSGLAAKGVMHRLGMALASYGGHLMIYAFCSNDIEGPAYERIGPRRDWSASWAKLAEAEPPPSRLWALVSGWRWRLQQPTPAADEEILHNFLENPAAWSGFIDALDRLAALASERGICAVVYLQPQLAELDDEHPYLEIYRRVGDAARERGIHVIDAFPAFRGRWASWYWINPFDPHPNAAGHAILARALADGLIALPGDCWQRSEFRPQALPR